MRRLVSWWRAVVLRRRYRAEIDEEMRFHLEREIEAWVARGLSRAEAEQRARAQFGAVGALREECREARGTRQIDATLHDLRYGLRVLRASPGFTTAAVLTLAFTIGAVSTVLTLVHAFYFQRWPVDRPEEIVEVQVTRLEGSRVGLASWSDFDHFRDGTRTLESLDAAYTAAPLQVTTPDDAFEVTGAVITAGFFPMLGVEPAAGRFFHPDEDAVPDRDRVVVLGHDFWRRWYGASPDAIGREIVVNETAFRVIGVAPADFAGFGGRPAEIYLPMMMIDVGYRWCSVLEDEHCTVLRMFGRRREGASVANVAAEMATLHPARWADGERGDNSGTAVRAVQGNPQSGVDRQFMRLLMTTGGVLFVVCCANLGGLMLSRGRARTAELAVRASLGASRRRLVRQLVTEAGLLAFAGAALGVVLSVQLTRLLHGRFYSLDSSGRTLAYDFGLRPEIIAGTALIAIVAGLVFGLAPAFGLVRRSVALERSGAGSWTRPRGHRWLLGLQAATASALVVMAGLLAASADARAHDANVDTDRLALLRLRPRLVEYPPEQAQAYVRRVIERLDALPDVESATMVGTGIALRGSRAEVSAAHDESTARVGYIEVGPRYFETLGTPILRGREFSASDDTGSPAVAVVSESLASALWQEDSAIGKTLRVNGTDRQVVGVVADVLLQARGESPPPFVFVPFWQNPESVDARLQVRVHGDPTVTLATLERQIRAVDPRVPVTETITMAWRMAGLFRPVRLSAAVVAYAAALAVVLSAIGLYASLAFAVARRTREIGVRQAIGASSRDIIAMVTGEGMRVIAAGVIGGMVLARISARLMRHLLYGATTGDLAFYVLAGALVSVVGLVACLVPALRAARVAPMRALRAG